MKKYNHKIRQRVFASLPLFLLLSFLLSPESFCQWKKIASFSGPVDCVFILDSGKNINYTGFAGTFNFTTDNPAQIWRTTDGGKSWGSVFISPYLFDKNITGFTFKDSLTGWFSVANGHGEYNPGNPDGCYKTIDRGKTWTPLFLTGSIGNGSIDCSAVYYNKLSKSLFLSRWGDYGLFSTDDGNTWNFFVANIGAYNLNGYAFLDGDNGIVSTVPEFGTRYYNYLATHDGGLTWQVLPFQKEVWQPIAFDNAIYALTDSTNTLYRTDDLGNTWYTLYTFPVSIVGTLQADANSIYAQGGGEGFIFQSFIDYGGIYRSADKGVSWQSICGPSNFFDTRFFVSDYGIWAGDALGGLWFNRTKKGYGPRLQIEKDNISRHIAVKAAEMLPINISYSKNDYYEPVDSVVLTLNYSEPLIYIRDSVATGWVVKSKQVNNSDISFVLQRTHLSPPQTDSFLLRIYFQAVVAKETSASLILDEVNFNGDTTFRDCMLASLSKTDSLFVDIQDQCGDSTLRQFLRTGKVLDIISIRPNPAQDEIEIDLESAIKQDANIEIRNALGACVYSGAKNLVSGSNSIHLNTKGLASGMYLVRVGKVSQSLVISR